MKKKNNFWICSLALIGFVLMLATNCKKDNNNTSNTVTDIDGNVFTTITIGTQVWMVETLKTTKYRNGDNIPTGFADIAQTDLKNGAYGNYDNDENNSKILGRLYNWYTVADSHGICPNGWHVPSDAEWTTLSSFLGGVDIAGGKMKNNFTGRWKLPNNGADNSSGFTALPGGLHNLHRAYTYISDYSIWWATTSYYDTYAYFRSLRWDNVEVDREYDYKRIGHSVRCIKD